MRPELWPVRCAVRCAWHAGRGRAGGTEAGVSSASRGGPGAGWPPAVGAAAWVARRGRVESDEFRVRGTVLGLRIASGVIVLRTASARPCIGRVALTGERCPCGPCDRGGRRAAAPKFGRDYRTRFDFLSYLVWIISDTPDHDTTCKCVSRIY